MDARFNSDTERSSDHDFSSTDELLSESIFNSQDKEEGGNMSTTRAWFEEAGLNLSDYDDSVPEYNGSGYKSLNLIQRGVQQGLRLAQGAPPVLVVTALIDASTDVFSGIPRPYQQLISCTAVMSSVFIHDGLRTAFTAESPLAYLRAAGNGSVIRGLGRELRATTLAMIPPVVAAFAYGSYMKSFCAHTNDTNAMITCLVLESPMLDLLVVGIPAFMLYGMTKALMECCDPLPANRAKENPQTRFFQDGLHFVMRGANAFWQAEMWRSLTLLFYTSMPHSRYMPLLALALDQLLLSPLDHFAFRPWSFCHLVPPGSEPGEREDAEYLGVMEAQVPIVDSRSRTLCSNVGGIVFYTAAGLITVGAAVGINHLLINKFTEDGDPENMSDSNRMGYQAAILAGGMILSAAIKAAPQLYRRALDAPTRWRERYSGCMSFFSRPVEPQSEVDLQLLGTEGDAALCHGL